MIDRRLFLKGFIAAAAAGSLGAAAETPTVATVANKQLLPFRGFNYQPSYGSTGFELWRRFDLAVIDRELTQGKTFFPAMNAIRFWLSWDAFAHDSALFAKNFEAALDAAAKHGLKVMPVLFNRWHDRELDYGGIYIDHFLPGASYMMHPGMFDPYLKAIVGAHLDDGRIFAWDLCNEPFSYFGGKQLADIPQIRDEETKWLTGLYQSCKALGAKAPLTVGNQPYAPLEACDAYCDVLCVHPYYEPGSSKPAFEQKLDHWVAFANKVNKPLYASETCWGSQDDAKRVEIIRYTLGELVKRDIGFLAYLLHHSLIADAHRVEFGLVGNAGNLSFIEADGTLRPGHGVWNDFAK